MILSYIYNCIRLWITVFTLNDFTKEVPCRKFSLRTGDKPIYIMVAINQQLGCTKIHIIVKITIEMRNTTCLC